jgi:hypothetical protein
LIDSGGAAVDAIALLTRAEGAIGEVAWWTTTTVEEGAVAAAVAVAPQPVGPAALDSLVLRGIADSSAFNRPQRLTFRVAHVLREGTDLEDLDARAVFQTGVVAIVGDDAGRYGLVRLSPNVWELDGDAFEGAGAVVATADPDQFFTYSRFGVRDVADIEIDQGEGWHLVDVYANGRKPQEPS